MNCLQSMAEYKPEDFGYDAGTLRGLYYYADTEIYNLPEKLVDYEKTEFVSGAVKTTDSRYYPARRKENSIMRRNDLE